jgi:hypothetical protein
MSLLINLEKCILVQTRDVKIPTKNPKGIKTKHPVTNSSTNLRCDILRTPKATTKRVNGRVNMMIIIEKVVAFKI